MTPFAAPLVNPPAAGTPPPPPPPPPPSFRVDAPAFYVETTSAAGSVLCATGVGSNGVPPYSYVYGISSRTSAKVFLASSSGASAYMGWTDMTPDEGQSLLLTLTCTDATGAQAQTYVSAIVWRTA